MSTKSASLRTERSLANFCVMPDLEIPKYLQPGRKSQTNIKVKTCDRNSMQWGYRVRAMALAGWKQEESLRVRNVWKEVLEFLPKQSETFAGKMQDLKGSLEVWVCWGE